jgi:hypothetical protein
MPLSDSSHDRPASPDQTDADELTSDELKALAEKLYDLLRREARLERERLGQTRGVRRSRRKG